VIHKKENGDGGPKTTAAAHIRSSAERSELPVLLDRNHERHHCGNQTRWKLP